MNQDLKNIFEKFIEKTRSMDEILGAWNFGSEMHGKADEYSDVDVVLLIDGESFVRMEQTVDDLLPEICDDVLLRWEEDFNGEAIVNNGYILRNNGVLFQFDVFLINNDMLDDFMCKIHYTDLSEKDIIFDKRGEVKRLSENSPKGSLWSADICRLQRTYWYHLNMAAKYLLRHDLFKLEGIFRTLYDTHASLLLSAYDTITWGGQASKLKYIPEEKQEHLKKYYCTDDLGLDRDNLVTSAELFEKDLSEILAEKNMLHKPETGIAVKKQLIDLTSEI
ncbi:MAG: hypothetical protein J1F11_11855 [Oscillospiraceae bacterium]|nr:hypothetical protein [Oscillospiraceae bacterium]